MTLVKGVPRSLRMCVWNKTYGLCTYHANRGCTLLIQSVCTWLAEVLRQIHMYVPLYGRRLIVLVSTARALLHGLQLCT